MPSNSLQKRAADLVSTLHQQGIPNDKYVLGGAVGGAGIGMLLNRMLQDPEERTALSYLLSAAGGGLGGAGLAKAITKMKAFNPETVDLKSLNKTDIEITPELWDLYGKLQGHDYNNFFQADVGGKVPEIHLPSGKRGVMDVDDMNTFNDSLKGGDMKKMKAILKKYPGSSLRKKLVDSYGSQENLAKVLANAREAKKKTNTLATQDLSDEAIDKSIPVAATPGGVFMTTDMRNVAGGVSVGDPKTGDDAGIIISPGFLRKHRDTVMNEELRHSSQKYGPLFLRKRDRAGQEAVKEFTKETGPFGAMFGRDAEMFNYYLANTRERQAKSAELKAAIVKRLGRVPETQDEWKREALRSWQDPKDAPQLDPMFRDFLKARPQNSQRKYIESIVDHDFPVIVRNRGGSSNAV
jgi:hypothetical protein